MSNLPSTRAEAGRTGSDKYFTGKACRNGHLAERYTQSGTCRLCIAASQQQYMRVPPGSTDARQQLIKANVRVSPQNYDRVLELTFNLTRIRFPTASKRDVVANKGGRDAQSGLLLYALYMHPDDVAIVRGFAASLIPQLADINAERARIFASALRQAEQAAEPEPAFKP